MSSSLASGLHQMPVVGDFIVKYLPIIAAVIVIAVVLIIVAVVRSRKKANSLPPEPPQPSRSSQPTRAAERPRGDNVNPPRSNPPASGGEYRGRHSK